MSEVELKFPGFTAKVESHGGGWGELGLNPLSTFFASLWDLHAVVPLASFVVREIGTDPSELEYTITAQDGRLWHQHMRFDHATDPGQNYEITHYWRLSEFSHHRALRDEVVALHNKYKLEKIEITILPNGGP